MSGQGDWLLVRELLERGVPDFVDRLRAMHDADSLGRFARVWYSSPAPAAREFLLAYLELPLNAYRHEPLIKRLFKLAESAGDDAVMAHFLPAFDRSIRRLVSKRHHYENQTRSSPEEADKLVAEWKLRGFESVQSFRNTATGRPYYRILGHWTEPMAITRRETTMPRGVIVDHQAGYSLNPFRYNYVKAPDWVGPLGLDPRKFADATEPPDGFRDRLGEFRLFGLATRHYLRRRAWRYFRRLAKSAPDRYLTAIARALVLYRDEDCETGLCFLDNWGLIHTLFHHSRVLVQGRRHWLPAEGHSLAELEPAPYCPDAWTHATPILLDILFHARCRPVRRWAMSMLSRDPAAASAVVETRLIELLSHEDSEVVAWTADLLAESPALTTVSADRWLDLALSANPEAIALISGLMEKHARPGDFSIAELVRMAASRPLPLAQLGVDWLASRDIASDDDREVVLGLIDAECQPLRSTILSRLRSSLTASDSPKRDWALAMLDSRHIDARAEGLAWFRADRRVGDDVELWGRLLETPYDDVQLALSSALEWRLADVSDPLELPHQLDPDRLRLLWASILLNIRRGGRSKPGVLTQLAKRLENRPQEAPTLLPLIALALRSVRRPERHAALAALVRLVEQRPEVEPLLRSSLPELQWS